MDPQNIISGLLTLVVGGFGWWIKNLSAEVNAQKEKIADLREEVVRTYMPRLEMQGLLERIYDKLDEIQRELTTKGKP